MLTNNIILSADSTCDIGPELQARYDVHFFNFHIQVGEQTYVDREEISPDDIYRAWRERGLLPKTAAITPKDYSDYFEKWVGQGKEIVHISLGSAISSAHQNCKLVAESLGHIYPVDSASLSTGCGLLVVKAGEMVRAGFSAGEIQRELNRLKPKVSATFILDTLEFMAAGGRCSGVMSIGANLLKLHPCILVDNANGGEMKVGKLYRGRMEKVLPAYVRDKLEHRRDLDLDRVFITSSGSPDKDFELVKAEIAKYANFREVIETAASGTISSHCGPRTLGILFMTK